MVLLECIRGGSEVYGDLDEIKAGALVSDQNDEVGEDGVANIDYKIAHEYCKACVPRRVMEVDPSAPDGIARDANGVPIRRLRQPGDQGTPSLYTVFGGKSSHKALYDFGIGVGLYFHQLLEFSVLCAVLFAVNLPVLLCNATFKRHLESGGPAPPEICGLHFEDMKKQYVDAGIWPSNYTIAQLDYKTNADWKSMGDYGYIKTQVTALQAAVEFASVFIMLAFLFFSKMYNEKFATKIDLSMQTAQDYGVIVTSRSGFLPRNASDIKQAYKELLPAYEVVSVSLVYNNRKMFKLLRKLVLQHRALSNKRVNELKNKKKNVSKADLERIEGQAKKEARDGKKIKVEGAKKFGIGCDFNIHAHRYYELLHEIDELNKEIEADSERKPKAAYVVFDTEGGARTACELYGQSSLEKMNLCGCTENIQRVKDVYNSGRDPLVTDLIQACNHEEAREPSDLLWENIGVSNMEVNVRSSLSWVAAGVVCSILFGILLAMKGDQARQKAGKSVGGDYVDAAISTVASMVIVVLNMALPRVMKASCSVEVHKSVTDKQNSMMTKLSIVRFFNTAILTFLLTPSGNVLSSRTITDVQSILIADLTIPAMSRLVDVYNLVMRYGVGRSAATQTQLNQYFSGTEWKLAERYTDVSKTIFVCLFYGAILPSGYAICAITFLVTYLTDKYLLLRRWREPPKYDDEMTKRSRMLLFMGVLAHVCVTKFFYDFWPFICPKGKEDDCNKPISQAVGVRKPTMDDAPSTTTIAIIMFIVMIATIVYFLKETILSKLYSVWKRYCTAKHAEQGGRATNLSYSTRETIDTYEPRLDIPPLDIPCVLRRGKYEKPTGFSTYMHDVACKTMSDFTGQENWKFAGQTSAPKQPFTSDKMFQFKLWFTHTAATKAAPVNAAAAMLQQQQAQQQRMLLQQQQLQMAQRLAMGQRGPAPQINPIGAGGTVAIQVTIPHGVAPGSLMSVQTPKGLVQVKVPFGMAPGMQFVVNV